MILKIQFPSKQKNYKTKCKFNKLKSLKLIKKDNIMLGTKFLARDKNN